MTEISKPLKTYINLYKILTESSRRFTGGLEGLGFNEFIILYHLENAGNKKLRRIDLAEKIGLTASGVTRLLAPMEKIGLIEKEAAARDARVSYVKITPAGERNLSDTKERAEELASMVFPPEKLEKISGLEDFLTGLGGPVRYTT